jgi:hypothetical protein
MGGIEDGKTLKLELSKVLLSKRKTCAGIIPI